MFKKMLRPVCLSCCGRSRSLEAAVLTCCKLRRQFSRHCSLAAEAVGLAVLELLGFSSLASFTMVKALSLACLGVLGFAGAHKPRTDIQKAFDQFLKDFSKDYDDVEKQARFGAFADNYEYIQRENAKGHSYTLGLNEFSDMTLDEFKMNRLGLQVPDSMWGSLPSLGTHKAGNGTLPSSVDWRSKAVTPVKNQQQCRS